MVPERSSPRSGRSQHYRFRLLLGYVLSLGTLLLVLQLPVSSSTTTEWLLPRPMEGLLVSEVQEASSDDEPGKTEEDAASAAVSAKLPPQTQQLRARSDAQGEGQGEDNAESPSDIDRPPDSSDIPKLTSLTDVKQPEMVGGMGAYYLQIQYPEAARQEGIEGRLRLQFVVNSDGSPEHIEVVEPLHPLTDTAAVRALRSVRFRPALNGGEPIPVWMSLPVRFRLVDSTRTQTAEADPSDSPE